MGGMGKPSVYYGPQQIQGFPVHVSHGQAAAFAWHPPPFRIAPCVVPPYANALDSSIA